MERGQLVGQSVFSDLSLKENVRACRTMDLTKIQAMRERNRIVMRGFLNGRTAEEVNWVLEEVGYPRLYARSFVEATVIYSLNHGFSMEQWLELEERCEKVCGYGKQYTGTDGLTLGKLLQYVADHSFLEQGQMKTQYLTLEIKSALDKISCDEQLISYLNQNVLEFVDVREKTTYYFVKYLYFYLEKQIRDFLEERRSGSARKQAKERLCELVSCGEAIRDVKSLSEQQITDRILASKITPFGVFGRYNRFYGENTTSNWCYRHDGWKEVSLEEIREYMKNHGVPVKEAKNCTEREARAWFQQEALKNGNFEYLQNGGNTIRSYLQGKVDLDRETLLSFLLFFSCEVDWKEKLGMTRERANGILTMCGYGCLQEKNGFFDRFFCQALQCSCTAEFEKMMEETVDESEKGGRDPFLYGSYSKTGIFSKKLKELLKKK